MSIEKLLNMKKRAETISANSKIALLEFSVAVEAEDPKKQEEARVKLHQLVDDQFDLQLELKHMRDEEINSILKKLK
tara:strand:+ start:18423 stop:18653 length:231 start_codon:yes stop_codon:yes gene_type:complete